MKAHSRLVKPNEPWAKKRFGQHFLRDKGVIRRIIRWIDPGPDDLFLEIGAGAGALSVELACSAARLLAIELDAECIPILETNLEFSESATVIACDFLQMDLAKLSSEYAHASQEFRIAGNLPYNIGTAIIEKLLHSDLTIQDMHFMLQLEVAERIVALPGSRKYGYLSVFCQHHCNILMGFKVQSACFTPRPKVDSAMIRFQPKRSASEGETDERHFEALAKAAFNYRRKTLLNSLEKHPVYGKSAEELLRRAGIDGSRRAEQLSVLEYEHLARTWSSCE